MKRLMKSWKYHLLMGLFGFFVVSGCIKKAVKPTAVEKPQEEVKKEEASEEGKPFTLESVVGQEWKEIHQLANVRFDLDKSNLTSEAKTALQKNAKFLKQYPQVEVRVAGHCDDRGTTEYNIALGQRRARTVRDYYKSLGISGSRLTTISFGEERPICTEETDACWAKNRRAETLIRVLSLDAKK